ncbi:Carotenoid isomerooxygenase-like 1 [Homarus americanus]|uniref:Carotenoid isomerooxygenase-like 1 n=1 Tax=Homarus americanus TaxID=6706 RepID=A0A8J5JHP7_HOMAM|nr:Carotenoid isomerooxygenase-like 1 [Homarus americanus]
MVRTRRDGKLDGSTTANLLLGGVSRLGGAPARRPRYSDKGVPLPLSTSVDSNCGKYDFSVLCRHCDQESSEPIPCQLTGTLPEWLKGQLIYNGPGLAKVGQNEYRHAFDSSALLQKFEISDGKVMYSNRFVRSKTFEQNQAAGAITRAEFGTPAPASKGMFSRFLDAMDPEKMFSDNALVSVIGIGGQHFAMCETPFMIQVNPDNLDTKERINVNKRYGLMTQSPHPILASDGVYTVGQGVGVTGPKYSILRFPLDGNLKQGKIVATVPARWRLSPAYMHSMAMTENYAILIEQPLAVSLSELLSDIVLIHIIDRKTWKQVKTRYITDPFFFMHVANAYEEGEHIVIDMPTYKNSSMLHNMFIKTLREQRGRNTQEYVDSFRSTMHRFVIPLNTKGKEKLITLPGTSCTASWSAQEASYSHDIKDLKTTYKHFYADLVTEREAQGAAGVLDNEAAPDDDDIVLQSEKLTHIPIENPCINPTKRATKHQYLWGMGPNPDGGDSGLVLKLDTFSGENKIFTEDKLYCGAPEFVAKPDAANEDDGILLLQCIDSQHEKKTYLLVLDAANMTEICRASVNTPSAVPMPLHGHYIPASEE